MLKFFLLIIIWGASSSACAQEILKPDTLFPLDLLSVEEIRTLDELVAQAEAIDEEKASFEEKAYVKLEYIWKIKQIPVCWEALNQSSDLFRSMVRQAVADTWEAYSSVSFTDWDECQPGDRGIRIGVHDVRPHTKGLGSQLDKIPDGLVLNETFKNWRSNCLPILASCSYSIAVHEFAHVLGFAHEQNRPDGPDDCDSQRGSQGNSTVGTPWDRWSVTNYCSLFYNNGGRLSRWDKYALLRLYGSP